jgi:hypothetical protein
VRQPHTVQASIRVIDRHFLYLPLYLAQFEPPGGKQPWFGKLPPGYSLEITVPEREKHRTDAHVFDELMNARLGSSDLMFAVCDPTVLLRRRDKNARMVAALIANSAFWAVNHHARDMRLISDLSSFDRIVCYEEGTTSNLIARRIARKDTAKLRVVPSTLEIQALKELGEGTLAISPEVLKIANLVHGELESGEQRAEIVMDLCSTKEFSNVLTTVLFTRAEVIDKHEGLVSALASALQSSLIAIHSENEVVQQCARSNFRDAYRVEDALAIATRGNVFPETIRIRRDRWQRACEFFFISQAIADGREKATLTRSEQLIAEECYEETVLDHKLSDLVSNAIIDSFRHGMAGPKPTLRERLRAAVPMGAAACAVFGFGFGVGHVFGAPVSSTSKAVMAASWLLMVVTGWVAGELTGFRKRSPLYVVNWAIFALLWWALHERFIPLGIYDAHFIAGLQLNDRVGDVIYGLASTWVASLLVNFAIERGKQRTGARDA